MRGLYVAMSLAASMTLLGCEEDQSDAESGGYVPPVADMAPIPDMGPIPDADLRDAEPPPGEIRPIDGEFDPLILGVWGSGSGQVWFAGGALGPEGGLVARFDGEQIAREATPPGPALWWIWGTDDDHVWACGEEGRILRRRDGRWVEEETGLTEETRLWGLWGSGPDDLWAVGGSPRADGDRNIVLRSEGDGVWRRVDDVILQTDPAVSFYKVWGSAPDAVHIVGEGGVAFFWNGRMFQRVDPAGEPEILFTVHGLPGGQTLAVGGLNRPRAVSWDGFAWQTADPPPLDVALNGVFVEPTGRALASGENGTLLARSLEGEWSALVAPNTALFGPTTLHAVWSGEDIWTVGGRFDRGRGGTIATDRMPAPTIDLEQTFDAGVFSDGGVIADAEVFDADVPDVEMIDEGVPDVEIPDIDVPDAMLMADVSVDDMSVPDVEVPDVEIPDAEVPDVEIPDVEIPDVEIPDAEVPDMELPDADLRPGPGEPCDAQGCRDDLECLGVFDEDRLYQGLFCIRECFEANECAAEFGEGTCCTVPGPQLFQPYCVPERFFNDTGCP
ncbi:MAG: WD40/YVTN/BNR-like repeat-containing protein [Bradymonadia bacterium]